MTLMPANFPGAQTADGYAYGCRIKTCAAAVIQHYPEFLATVSHLCAS